MFAYTKIMQALAAAGVVPAATDPYFNLTTLLLNTSSTNGAQNNTFLDSSTNNFTITRNGNTTQGTFTPFSQTGWSNYLSNSSNYLTVPANSNFIWSTGARTYEAWVYVTSVASNNAIFGLTNLSSSNTWELYIDTSSQVVFRYFAGGAQTVTTTGTVPLNTWAHIAFVYDGTSGITIYINGVSSGTGTKTGTPVTDNNQLCIGRTNVGGAGDVFFSGYISNVRFTTTTVYTSNFTPSTTPLTAVTGTSLLTCQSNRFIDNSSSPATITINGTPSVQAFSPFLPTAAYSTSVVGGSGYFDGSGDYLTCANNAVFAFGTGDFTIETWLYPTAIGTNNNIFFTGDNATGQANLRLNAGKVEFFADNSGPFILTGATTLKTNTWSHIVFSRVGSTNRIFVNGVQDATATNSYNYSGSGLIQIGYWSANPGVNYYSGYMSGLRVQKGTGYSSITVPTAPPTAITNTSFLLNFTNAGIYDSASKNVLETVGNAQVSTTQAKWGTTAIYLDGTGDYAKFQTTSAANYNFTFGSGDFTIEMWVYPSNTSTVCMLVGQSDNATIGGGSFLIRINGNVDFYSGGTAYTCTGASPSANQWSHIAYVRNGTSLKTYLNGTQVGSTTLPSSTTAMNVGSTNYPPILGAYSDGSGAFTGYIDDLRISKFARYTASFTPPSSAFATQ